MTAKAISQPAPGRPPSVHVRAVTGFPVRELISASQEADLVVVGSRGAGGFARLPLGSVSSQVVQHAHGLVAVEAEQPRLRPRRPARDQGGNPWTTASTAGRAQTAETATPEEISRFVVEAAVHAPSVHNTQPWWFGRRRAGDQLTPMRTAAAPRRSAWQGDVHQLRRRAVHRQGGTALPGPGAAVRVLPDPDLPNLVARVGYGGNRSLRPTTSSDLFAEIPRRRTHRGGFDPEPCRPA